MSWVKVMPQNALLALLVTILVVVWIGSGMLDGSSKQTTATDESVHTQTTVIVKKLKPQLYTRVVKLIGRSEPLVEVNLAAQTNGEVAELLVDRGE